MDNAPLVPPKPREVSLRYRFWSAAYGAVAGALLGVIGWAVTGELHWVYLTPVCAIAAFWLCDEAPNVLWGRREQ